MNVFGYSKNEGLSDELLELEEVTFQADSKMLKEIAKFLLKTADTMEKHGEQFGHEHFKDHVSDKKSLSVDVIVAKGIG